MIYPIITYGDPMLRKKAKAVEKGTMLKELVQNMLDTMQLARGIGLAAPQIGKSMRLFVVDLSQNALVESAEESKKVMVNPVLTIDETAVLSRYEEGCLSIPNILVEVPRREKVTVRYFDTQWQLHEETWTGFPARVIQHEYDHLEGRLHIDYASSLRKRLLQGRLKAISQGKVDVAYKMHFPAGKK